MDDIEEQWFVAVLVLRSRVGEGWQQDEPFLDHQVRLLRAASAEVAYARAQALGAEEEHSYENADGAVVRWEFLGLADLDRVNASSLVDGVEVYSWQRRGEGDEVVQPKERLTAFYVAANASRTARDLLE